MQLKCHQVPPSATRPLLSVIAVVGGGEVASDRAESMARRHSVLLGRSPMYAPHAVEMRRCSSVRKDGQPCRAWAVWGDDAPWPRCAVHLGRAGRPGQAWSLRRAGIDRERRPTRPTACTCPAYAWPHRPGGGLCEWPSEPWRGRLTTTAGTRSGLPSGLIGHVLRWRFVPRPVPTASRPTWWRDRRFVQAP